MSQNESDVPVCMYVRFQYEILLGNSTRDLSGPGFGLNSTSTGGGANSPSRGHSNKTSNEAWVCPNDRQLALRAK